jgi:hypothetical protein
MTDTPEKVTPTPTKRKVRVKSRVGSGSLKNYVCISKGTEVKRVLRTVASTLVANQGWNYAKRSLWKKEVRDIKGYVAPVVEHKETIKKAKKVKPEKPG